MNEIKGIRIVSLTGEKEYGIEDSEVREELANVVDGAPEELDSFKEAFEKFKEGGEALAGIVADVAAAGKAVADETERAEQAEQTLDDKITAEADRARGAEQVLDRKIDEETRRAEQAEEAIVENTDKKIAAEVEKLKDGDTIVGQAREIHSRNGKTVTDSFLARTTAGSGTIGDGVASLKSVSGNIVKNLIDATNTNSLWGITSFNNNVFYSSPSAGGITMKPLSTIIDSHKYYIRVEVYSNSAVIMRDMLGNDNRSTATSSWQSISVLNSSPTSKNISLFESGGSNGIFMRHPLVIDLTEIFGAGKEPDKDTCDRLFGTMDALPQGLSFANPTEFKSTGFNQFNPENVIEDKAITNNAIVSGDKKIAVIPCLPCKVGVGENNGYCIHGEFGEDIKVYLTPLNPMEVDGELYMHELTKDATTDTYVPLIKGYLLVEVPTTANLCAHFLWSEDKCERDTYEPYFESKVELPVIPQMSEWGLAGLCSNVDAKAVYDTIDLENSRYTRRIGCRKIKELSWSTGVVTANGVSYRYFYTPDKFMQIKAKCLLEGYVKVKQEALSVKELANLTFMAYDTGRIYLRSTASTINEFLASDGEKRVFYELITPEVYPIIVTDNNYISSDYGVEQFDGSVPCNANNLYYMRSLAGETRNFLDRLMAGLGTSDATVVADRILAVVNPAVEPANVEPETSIEE